MYNSCLPRQLFVRSLSGRANQGFLDLGFTRIPCRLGRTGKRALKREGDGATPRGRMAVLSVYFRRDRISRPSTMLATRSLSQEDGWCDAPTDRNYNRRVRHPYPASAEHLWRTDHLYDVIGVLDYNIDPRCRGRGSAIFLHLMHPDGNPTEGCIAVRQEDVKRLLCWIGPKTEFII